MKKKTVVDLSHCAACGECVRVCPKNAVSVFKGSYAVVNLSICIGCRMCERECPSGAIKVINEEQE